MTGCVCKEPGWCERHQCQKHAHWHHLCQTNEDYFQAWEAGRGPGQGLPKVVVPREPRPRKEGWGDAVTAALKKIGITEDRYKAVKELFGLPPTCGCPQRREWLNKVGRWWTGEK